MIAISDIFSWTGRNSPACCSHFDNSQSGDILLHQRAVRTRSIPHYQQFPASRNDTKANFVFGVLHPPCTPAQCCTLGLSTNAAQVQITANVTSQTDRVFCTASCAIISSRFLGVSSFGGRFPRHQQPRCVSNWYSRLAAVLLLLKVCRYKQC